MRALDNPMGVFTNDPLLGEQYKVGTDSSTGLAPLQQAARHTGLQ
jgi:hypothetical protein